MPYSHHCHSGQFCKHASGTLEEVVLEAIRQGFQTYGLTEHVPRYRSDDLYPEEAGLSPDDLRAQFEAFLDEAHRVKKQYAEQITILVGLETEYITEADLTGLSSILSDHGDRIEYIVGSIHHVGGIPIDFDLATFTKALNAFANSPPPVPLASDSGPPGQVTDTDADAQTAATTTAFLCAYLDAQYTLMQRFHPEIIGHFDLCRLYTPTLRFASYPAALDRVRRNVRYAVEYGALFELNAAAFRKGWDAAYPGEDVVEIIQAAGGRFALSDDSHGPHAVGLNYDRLLEYTRRMGIEDVWVLASPDADPGSKGVLNAGGRKVVARKVEDLRWRKFGLPLVESQ
ncbi:polymerase/histidinol phosphatase-like protein [Earliella scabrosa]|nr:polymerase/histidinol phosphatase-like protein [Earliella scabrosa]